MEARDVVVIITGAHKANALHKCIEEGVSHMWTVSALQLHQRSCIVCDEDATLELKVKTVRYFKGIQETQEHINVGIPRGSSSSSSSSSSSTAPAIMAGYQGLGQSDRPGARLASGIASPRVALPPGVDGGMHNKPDGTLFIPSQ